MPDPMHNPMTQEEWQKFCSMTLHGAPPWKTLRRIYATIDARDIEIESLRKLVWGGVHNAGRLGAVARPRWACVAEALAVGSTHAHKLCTKFGVDPNEEVGGRELDGDEDAEL